LSSSLDISAGTMGLTAARQTAVTQSASNVSAADRNQIKKSAEDFEAIFLEIFLKSMRTTVQKSGFIDGGNAEDIYRGMLDFEYSKAMAAQRGSGLAEAIERQMLRTAESVGSPPPPAANNQSGLKAYQDGASQGLQTSSKQGTIGSDPAK